MERHVSCWECNGVVRGMWTAAEELEAKSNGDVVSVYCVGMHWQLLAACDGGDAGPVA